MADYKSLITNHRLLPLLTKSQALESEDTAGLNDPCSSIARNYLESRDHVSGPDLEVIRNLAATMFPSLTVDVAAGPGHALRAAAPFSGTCLALDLNIKMLQVARDHITEAGLKEVHVLQSAADNLPVRDGSISLLTCRIAPHHFPSIPDFLSEIHRVLDPDGRGVVVDNLVPADHECDRFLNEAERFRDPTHVHAHTIKQWQAFFMDAGLVLLASSTFERTHRFHEWAPRAGLDAEGVAMLEKMFLKAPERVRECFLVDTDERDKVLSYTDRKGIWVVRKKR